VDLDLPVFPLTALHPPLVLQRMMSMLAAAAVLRDPTAAYRQTGK
jgi:hypothetical protein